MIFIDSNTLQERYPAFKALQNALALDDTIRNLDALFDALTGLSKTVLVIEEPEDTVFTVFYKRLRRVLKDAAEENSDLLIIWKITENEKSPENEIDS